MSDQFTDAELLESVTGHLQAVVDRGNAAEAWVLGATWASRKLLMGDVLRSIQRVRETADDPVTDEELASRIASTLRFDAMVMGLEVRSHDRHQAEFRQRVEDSYRREAEERAADPAKQAAWEAEQAELAERVADIKKRAARGELKDDSGWIQDMLRTSRRGGVGHRMALAELAREEEDRLRRIRLVRAWLAERLDPADCPPWALAIFEEV